MTAGSAARKPLMAGNCGASPGDAVPTPGIPQTHGRTPGHYEEAV